mgnify:CR=1 FL=1
MIISNDFYGLYPLVAFGLVNINKIPEWQNSTKWTMLHMAVYKANPDMVRLLVYCGANLNLKDVKSMTPEESVLVGNDP